MNDENIAGHNPNSPIERRHYSTRVFPTMGFISKSGPSEPAAGFSTSMFHAYVKAVSKRRTWQSMFDVSLREERNETKRRTSRTCDGSLRKSDRLRMARKPEGFEPYIEAFSMEEHVSLEQKWGPTDILGDGAASSCDVEFYRPRFGFSSLSLLLFSSNAL